MICSLFWKENKEEHALMSCYQKIQNLIIQDGYFAFEMPSELGLKEIYLPF